MRRVEWRYLFYIAYILLRVWQIRADGMFPVYDGIGYYAKAHLMAERPLVEAMPWRAFSLIGLRPPGPMWLMLPFMVVQASPTVFVFALSFWICAFIEMAVRIAFPRKQSVWRNGTAALLIAGLNVLYVGLEMFYVDGLLAAESVLMCALALAYTRRPHFQWMFAFGAVAALAIWTKPAGVYVTAAGMFAIAIGLLFPFSKRRVVAAARDSLAALPFLVIALATLFFTPYKAVLSEAFQGALNSAGLTAQSVARPFSSEGFDIYRHTFRGTIGNLTTVWLVMSFIVLAGFARGSYRLRRRRILVPMVMAFAMYVLISSVPYSAHRFNAPTVGLMLFACGAGYYAILLRYRNFTRVWLLFGVAVAVIGQLMFVTNRAPRMAGFTSVGFRNSMHHVRELFGVLEREFAAEPRRERLLATDFIYEIDCLNIVQYYRELGIHRVVATLGMHEQFELQMPWWPEYRLDPLQKFHAVDFVAVSPLDVSTKHQFQPEAGSAAADWRRLNNELNSTETAASLGLELIHERVSLKLFRANKEPKWQAARSQFIMQFPWTTQDGKILGSQMQTASRVRDFAPATRDLYVERSPETSGSILIHPDYRGSTLPSSVQLECRAGEKLRLRSQDPGQGDGLIATIAAGDTLTTLTIAPGQEQTYSVSTTGTLQLAVDPGSTNNTLYDVLAVRLLTN